MIHCRLQGWGGVYHNYSAQVCSQHSAPGDIAPPPPPFGIPVVVWRSLQIPVHIEVVHSHGGLGGPGPLILCPFPCGGCWQYQWCTNVACTLVTLAAMQGCPLGMMNPEQAKEMFSGVNSCISFYGIGEIRTHLVCIDKYH